MEPLRFRLPADLPESARRWLAHAYLVRGAESCPIGSSVTISADEFILQPLEEGGPVAACVPWPVDGEIWMLSTTTLLPGKHVYDLLRELARGQLHRVRDLARDWSEAGLELPAELHARLRQAVRDLLMATETQASARAGLANQVLHTALVTGQALTLEIARYLAQLRQQRSPVPFYFGWSAGGLPLDSLAPLREAFQGIRLALPFDPALIHKEAFWKELEGTLRWVHQQGWRISLGPIFDFASERFLQRCRMENGEETFLEAAGLFLSRAVSCAEQVEDWHITAATNFFPSHLSLEDGLAFLGRLLRPVKRFLAGKQVSVGLAQPYGEQAARSPERPVPLLLADWVSRADWGVNALELELIFGCEPRGGFLRPPWSVSQLLDWFADIRLPLQISLGLPASAQTDPLADPPDQEVLVAASSDWQAAWASALLDLALAHPSVQRITWLDASDSAPHVVPHGGLLDGQGQPRPVLRAFRQRGCSTNTSKAQG